LATTTTSKSAAMALRELPSVLGRLAIRESRSNGAPISRCCKRFASTEAKTVQWSPMQKAAVKIEDLEPESTFTSTRPPDEHLKSYDPVKRASSRRRQLPPSRYVTLQLARSRIHKSNHQLDTNFDHQDTTEVLYIPTSPPLLLILHLESLCLARSIIHVLNKHTRP